MTESTEATWKEWMDGYLREIIIYIAKDPKDFFVRWEKQIVFTGKGGGIRYYCILQFTYVCTLQGLENGKISLSW